MENTTNLKNKVVSSFFWQLLQKLSTQIISFSVSVFLARLLMPDDFGVVALSTMFILLFGIVTGGGIGVALIQKKDVDEMDYSTVFYFGVVFSVLIYSIIFIISPYIALCFHNEQITPVLRYLALSMPIGSLGSVQRAIIQKQIEFKKLFMSSMLGSFLSATVGLSMAFMGFGVWALVLQHLVSISVNTFVLIYIVHWYPKLLFSFTRLKSLFSYGWKLMITDLLATFNYQLKGYLIGMKYSATELAFYNRGEGMPGILYNNINGSISSVLFPALVKLQDNPDAIKRTLRRAMSISSFVLMPCLLGLTAISDKLVLIVFSSKWAAAIPYMQVICFTCCFDILGMANIQALKAIGRSDTLLKLEFIKRPLMITMIVCAVCISPLAIAISMLMYSVCAFMINAFPNKKYIKYSITEQIRDVMPNFGLSLITAIIVYLLGFIFINMYYSVCIQILSGIAIYIFLSRSFNKENYSYVIDYIKEKIHQNA